MSQPRSFIIISKTTGIMKSSRGFGFPKNIFPKIVQPGEKIGTLKKKNFAMNYALKKYL